MNELAVQSQAMDFLTDQYRHVKPLMVMGAFVEDFCKDLVAHRHSERETDSPVV